MHTGTQPCGNPAHNTSLAPLAEQLAAAVVLSRFSLSPDDVARVVFWLLMALLAGGAVASWLGRRR